MAGEAYETDPVQQSYVLGEFIGGSWNSFRYAGDLLHDVAVVIILLQVVSSRSVAGLSWKTQVGYLLVFSTRYLDLLDYPQTSYIVGHKLYFLGTSLLAVLSFRVWRDTYEREKDTFMLSVILLPSAAAALLTTNELTVLEVLWTFSEMLEGAVMVPQYVFSYRDVAGSPRGILAYMLCMGLYRACYCLNFVHKKIHSPHYSDVQSWIGGALNFCFFADYLLSRAMGVSLLRRLTLGADNGIRVVGGALSDRFGACLLPPGAIAVEPRLELNAHHHSQDLDEGSPLQYSAPAMATCVGAAAADVDLDSTRAAQSSRDDDSL